MSEWQSIKTQPEIGDYLIYMPGNRERIMVCRSARASNGIIRQADGFFMWDDDDKPTHWMPLPEPPK